jgi:hypothetical protein
VHEGRLEFVEYHIVYRRNRFGTRNWRSLIFQNSWLLTVQAGPVCSERALVRFWNRIGITTAPPPSDEDEPIVLRSASRAISCHSLARCQYLTRMSWSVLVNAVRWHSLAFSRHRRTASLSLNDPFK